MPTSPAWSALGAEKYVSLTTFRRDGTPVATPVWVVADGDRLLVTTTASTGKVKRLRHTPRVTLRPCDMRGRVRDGAPEVEATATVEDDPALLDRLNAAIVGKYGLYARFMLWAGRRRGMTDRVCVTLSPA